MTSKITGIYRCLKIGALICCLTVCSLASGHYYATKSASTENAIVTNEEDSAVSISLQGFEQVAGLSFDTDELKGIPGLTAQTVVTINAASQVIEETTEAVAEETEPATEPVTEQETEPITEQVTEAQTEAEPVVSEQFANLAVATVTADWLNIRSEASSDAEIVGKLYPGSAGQIVEESGDWTKISSGSVTGWVNNGYIVKRIDAQNSATVYGKPHATINVSELRVRAKASTDSKVLGSVDEGKSYSVISILDGWLEIRFDGTSGFIASEYATIGYSFDNAISIEEERAAIAEQERLEAERKAAEEAKKMTIETTYGSGITLSEADIVLMSAVVQNEAGGSCYENKLAVANVILNRLRSGRWGSTVSEVIHAKGQFSGANNGRIDSLIAAGPKSCCREAVMDALSGKNNIGDIMFFCYVKIMNPDKYASYTVIGDNCFYVRK